jgi:hypothetical protein
LLASYDLFSVGLLVLDNNKLLGNLLPNNKKEQEKSKWRVEPAKRTVQQAKWQGGAKSTAGYKMELDWFGFDRFPQIDMDVHLINGSCGDSWIGLFFFFFSSFCLVVAAPTTEMEKPMGRQEAGWRCAGVDTP